MTLSNPAQYISGRTVQEQMNSLIDYVDQRAADVALDAIASDVAQVHQDMLDADADASAAAASAAAAAGTLANAVKKTGEVSQSIAGDIAVAGDLSAGGDLGVTGDAGVQGQLSVLGGCDLRAPVKIPVTPTNNDDAASKKYVDDADALKISITDINTYGLGLTGNQTYSGTKESGTLQIANSRPYLFQRVNAESKWFKVFECSSARRIIQMDVAWSHQSYNGGGAGRILFGLFASSNIFAKWLYRYSSASAFTADTVFIGVTPDSKAEIWVKANYYVYCEIVRAFRGNVEETISNITNAYDGVGESDIDLTRFSYYAYGSE